MERLNHKPGTIVLIFLSLFIASIAQASAPVLLTFDVEKENDEKNLKDLNITVPATYFFLGKFIEEHSEFVAALAKNNTVGSHAYSHSNLTKLSWKELYAELQLTKALLEKTTGKTPKWFRAPYLEFDNNTLTTLKKLGFRYDSSEQERWGSQEILLEMPISGQDGRSNLISDYDVFEKNKLSDDSALEWFKQRYLERSDTGRPLVILLHPSIITQHKEVLSGFINFVQKEGGSFITGDQWAERMTKVSPQRIGLWVDFTMGTHKVEEVIKDIKSIGATDIFLMAKDYEGHAYFSDSKNGNDLFGQMYKALKLAGIRVHAWLPVLMSTNIAQTNPEWAMFGDNNEISLNWLSPSNPEVKFLVKNTIKTLLDEYELDGIHLDYIRYPGLGYDFSDQAVDSFIKEKSLENIKRGDLLSKYYMEWVDWRTQEITHLVQSIRETIDFYDNRKIELSAALIADASTLYRSQENFGQNYSQLAKYLDLIIPMAYFKDDKKPAEWISNVIASSRYRIGNTELLIGLASYQQPNKWKLTSKEFENGVKLAVKGTDGIVFYNYLNLFGRGDEASNMEAENINFLRDYLSEIKNVGMNSLKLNLVPSGQSKSAFLPRLPIQVLISGLVVILFIFAFVWRHIKKEGIHGQSLSSPETNKADLELSDFSKIDFSALESKIHSAKAISPDVFSEVSMILKSVGPQRIRRYRQMKLLETIKDSPMTLEGVLQKISPINNDLSGLKRIEEAGLLGYLGINGIKLVTITDSGHKTLKKSIEEGYNSALINFIDQRLKENIVINCPRCDSKTLGYWFWGNYECSGCNQESEVINSPNLFVKNGKGLDAELS